MAPAGAVTFGDVTGRSLDLIPEDVRSRYEVREWRNATSVLVGAHPQEWNELLDVLRSFRLRKSSIIVGGGGKSKVPGELDGRLYALGWKEKGFDTKITVDEAVYESPTHKVDCFKGKVAVEIEWNNKTEFYDRDLNNFRLLFELRVVDVGVIVTRQDELDGLFKELGIWPKYGTTSTVMRKLIPKLEGGGGGGCPVLVFGIGRNLYLEDV